MGLERGLCLMCAVLLESWEAVEGAKLNKKIVYHDHDHPEEGEPREDVMKRNNILVFSGFGVALGLGLILLCYQIYRRGKCTRKKKLKRTAKARIRRIVSGEELAVAVTAPATRKNTAAPTRKKTCAYDAALWKHEALWI